MNLVARAETNLTRGAFRPTIEVEVINLYTNPSFEIDVNAITCPANLTKARKTTDGKYGTSCLLITSTSGFPAKQINFYQQNGIRIPVTPGEWYTISMWVKEGAALSSTFHIGMQWFDAGSTAIFHSWGIGEAQGVVIDRTFPQGWVWYWFTAQAPSNAVSARFNIEESAGMNVGESVLVDGVMITQTHGPVPYGDGDQEGWTWTGTPHASTSRRSAYPISGLAIPATPISGINVTGRAS